MSPDPEGLSLCSVADKMCDDMSAVVVFVANHYLLSEIELKFDQTIANIGQSFQFTSSGIPVESRWFVSHSLLAIKI